MVVWSSCHEGAQDFNWGAGVLNGNARKVFNILRGQYDNTAALAADLLNDHNLQLRLRIIAGSLRPLHDEYKWDFEVQKQGQEGMMELFARRANFHFYNCVVKMFDLLQDSHWIEDLELCPASGNEHCQPDDSVCMKSDASVLKTLFQFNVHMASNRCWSQAFYSLLFPYAFSGIYHPDPEQRGQVMSRMSKMAQGLLDLEDYCLKHKDNHASSLLKDLSTNKWQLTREMLIQGEGCKWNSKNREMQWLAWACFAGPGSTKDVMELAVNWLKDSLRSAKNKLIKGWTKFLYLLCSPYTAASGVATLVPTISDFTAYLSAQPSPLIEIPKMHPFNPLSADLNRKILPNAQAVENIRFAGYHTNRNGAAAAAFLLKHTQTGQSMDKLPQAWPG